MKTSKKLICILFAIMLFGCHKYEIDQQFNNSNHETMVWIGDQMGAKWVIPCDSFSSEKVKQNRIKAEKFIIELKKLESK